MKYRFEYYTLSDGRATVEIEGTSQEAAEIDLRKIYQNVDYVISCSIVAKPPEKTVWCEICQDHIGYQEMRKERADDETIRSICPGCGSELLEPYYPL